MSLSNAIRKYRDTDRKTSGKKAPSRETDGKETHSRKQKDQDQLSSQLPSKQTAQPPVEPSTGNSTGSSTDGPVELQEIEKAVVAQETQETAIRVEIELQKEIAEDIEREAAQTSTLVREDFSPLNCTRDRLINEYSPLIRYIAQKIAARLPANIELDDLMSAGVIGLMDAIDKYDPKRDNKFKTYAEFRIRGAILDELRAQDWVPRSVREKAKQLERCYAKLENEKGRHVSDEEICSELNMTQEEFYDLLNQVRSVSLVSYDDITNFSKADKRQLHGFGDTNIKSPTPLNEVTVGYLKRLISDSIKDLPEKQRLVLSLYYYEDLNLKEIGRILDVTESRVSQLHTQAVIRLKSRLKTHWDDFVALMA